MPQAKALYAEIIDEIGTQTLAKFGLNIFSLNTYAAYSVSAKATNIINDTYNRHKNNPNAFGQYFEDIDVGESNIKSALFNTGEQKFTTDELSDIKKVAEIIASGKKIEKLNPKDRSKYDFVIQNYANEVSTIIGSSKEEFGVKNDASTDTVTFDKNGNVVEKSQHKVIKNTNDLLKDRYLENNDVLTMPFDDYKKHKENLEKMVKESSNPEKAKKALTMLNKNNMTNRLMCENPRATAMMMQTGMATTHIVQAGLSDTVIVALSTLANGAIWEIKDAYNSSEDISISIRIRRLLKKVIQEFNKTFKRGASFGALEIGIDILQQIFKSVFSKIKTIFQSLKTSIKSIYNAIYSYMNGEIKSYKELISTILKGLLSGIVVVGTVVLETQLEAFLSPILTPLVATFIAPALSIIVGSLAVVSMMNGVDIALNALFGAFTKRDIAKMKAEEVKAICEELLPDLISEKNELKELINKTYKDRKLTYDKSFSSFKYGLSNINIEALMNGLIGINSMYCKKLQFATFDEFDTMMLSDGSFKL